MQWMTWPSNVWRPSNAWLVLFLLAITGGLAPLRAETVTAFSLLDAPIDYSAHFTLTVGQQTYDGTLMHSPGRERRDFQVDGKPQALILRRDNGRAFVLWPEQKWYIEADLHTAAKMAGEIDRATIDSQVEGTALVDGERCSVLRLSGKTFHGRAWETKDGILVKAEGIAKIGGRDTEVTSRLLALRRTAIDPSSFTPPTNYFGLPLAIPGSLPPGN